MSPPCTATENCYSKNYKPGWSLGRSRDLSSALSLWRFPLILEKGETEIFSSCCIPAPHASSYRHCFLASPELLLQLSTLVHLLSKPRAVSSHFGMEPFSNLKTTAYASFSLSPCGIPYVSFFVKWENNNPYFRASCED